MSRKVNHSLVNARVESTAVGDKAGFLGTVVSAWEYESSERGRPIRTYFHVRDDADGSVWQRDLHELSTIEVSVAMKDAA